MLIQRTLYLTRNNFDETFGKFLLKVDELNHYTWEGDVYNQIMASRRQPLGKGPYPELTFFEAGSRIANDILTFLSVQHLLDGKVEGAKFYAYEINLGHKHPLLHDIAAPDRNTPGLIAECSNVSDTVFIRRAAEALKKMQQTTLRHRQAKMVFFYSAEVKATYHAPSDFVRIALDIPVLLYNFKKKIGLI